MNRLIALCLFLLLPNIAWPQSEQIVIEKRADTIVVINKDVVENCAAKFATDVSVQGFDVIIVETDTVEAKANCICNFDLSAYLTGLQTGAYTVTVYRQYWKKYQYPEDRKVLIVDTSFAVTQPQPGAQYSRVLQSPCHGLNAVDPDPVQAEELTARVFPNPATHDVTVRLELAFPQRITVLLFDALGTELAPPQTLERSSGTYELAFPASIFRKSGVYYCAVIRSAGVKIVPFTVTK